ncbi:hypothetical protein ACFLYR_02885 [Chloroflexota bacterium]
MENQGLGSESSGLDGSNTQAVRYLQQAIKSGSHWYIALLEAIGLWSSAEETYGDRTYCYLIAGEAFDWLLLAERLCDAVDGWPPDEEKRALLFQGRPPLDLSQEEFRRLIGGIKYHQLLNYFYGVIVEEALILAVREEVRKEWLTQGYTIDRDTTNEVYRRIYGSTRAVLLKKFRQEKGHPQVQSAGLTELKEFTYWLFKYRLEHCEKTRVASDTKKALGQLDSVGFSQPWQTSGQ